MEAPLEYLTGGQNVCTPRISERFAAKPTDLENCVLFKHARAGIVKGLVVLLQGPINRKISGTIS